MSRLNRTPPTMALTAQAPYVGGCGPDGGYMGGP